MIFDPPLSLAEIEHAFAGQFSSLEHIYSGGQGAVFRAVPAKTLTPTSVVALKVYFPEQLTERTEREVAALRRLSSPELVRLFDSGRIVLRNVDCIYVATDFIEGEALSDVIARNPLSLAQASKVGIDIATAIDLLWKERIVHRDIKPPNIMRTLEGRCVLIDLGVARHLSLETITMAGMTWGTVGYMAPEHARAQRQLSCKADVFSLGIVLQQCILGRHPTNGRQDLLLNGGLPTSTLTHTVPPELCTVIDSMVTRDALARPLPAAIRTALETFLSSKD